MLTNISSDLPSYAAAHWWLVFPLQIVYSFGSFSFKKLRAFFTRLFSLARFVVVQSFALMFFVREQWREFKRTESTCLAIEHTEIAKAQQGTE